MVDIAEGEVGDRIELRVVGNNFVPHGHRVSAYITSKFKLRQYASGHTWGHLDEDGKDFYYKEFLKIYTWQPGKEEQFKSTWNLNSEVAGTGTGVTKHTAGSRSIIEHTLKLEADLKRKIDCWEVFRITHHHKDGTFVDARSQAIDDNMTTRISEISQATTEGEEPHTPSHDAINDIYYEVVGGMKKRCIYGLGSQAKVAFPHATSTSTGRVHPSNSCVEIQELRAENADLKTRVNELEEKMREFMARFVDSDETQAP
ncbi:uncharacterized protein [Primulina eburnea]|uniref:uncharacterized protein n=1 Tax=Primulina eburnea TaxID=1245227 RepID=UPI003C6BF1ED